MPSTVAPLTTTRLTSTRVLHATPIIRLCTMEFLRLGLTFRPRRCGPCPDQGNTYLLVSPGAWRGVNRDSSRRLISPRPNSFRWHSSRFLGGGSFLMWVLRQTKP